MVVGTCAADTLEFGLATYSDEGGCDETHTSKKIRVLNNDPDADSCASSPACVGITEFVVGTNAFSLPVTGLFLPASCGDGGTAELPLDPVINDPRVYKFIPPTTGTYTLSTCK